MQKKPKTVKINTYNVPNNIVKFKVHPNKENLDTGKIFHLPKKIDTAMMEMYNLEVVWAQNLFYLNLFWLIML